MAKKVKFGKKSTKKKSGVGDTSFNFGFNALSKTEKKKYRKKTGGGS